MLPIYISYDSEITREEETVILASISEALVHLKHRGSTKILGSDPWLDGDYPSVDWYKLKTTTIYQGEVGHSQLDAGRFLYLVVNTQWPTLEPHIDLIFMSQDLTARDKDGWLNFVFGVADKHASVQSIARLRDIPDKHDRMMAIKALTQHSLGYMLGAKSADASLDPHMAAFYNPGNCHNFGCMMQNGSSPAGWVEIACEAHQSGTIYCSECLRKIARYEQKDEKRAIREEIWR